MKSYRQRLSALLGAYLERTKSRAETASVALASDPPTKLSPIDYFPQVRWGKQAAFAEGHGKPSPALIERLCRSYQHQVQDFHGYGDSPWASLHEKSRPVHDALISGDDETLRSFLVKPSSTNLFYGFESVVSDSIETFKQNPEMLSDEISTVCDRILQLAEATGAAHLWYPEAFGARESAPDLEALLSEVDRVVGTRLTFPNPFADEFGVATTRGIASYRAVQAIYQAWRLRELSALCGTSIAEIGGGLGRTALYANILGLKDYTLIDLPLTTIAQANFLSRTLGENAVTLPGEAETPGSIRIETPNWFNSSGARYDLIANIDSMVEMDTMQAEQYARSIRAHATLFLSINHEYFQHRVTTLQALAGVPRMRHPYWMRKGYAEEIFFLQASPSLNGA